LCVNGICRSDSGMCDCRAGWIGPMCDQGTLSTLPPSRLRKVVEIKDILGDLIILRARRISQSVSRLCVA
jgi:hypothetical protein